MARWLCGAMALAALASGAAPGRVKAAQAPEVIQINLSGIVEPITATYVERGIAEAAHVHASAILLELSTPGGLETSMRAIIKSIVNSPVPVITYVYPSGSRSASAGFFILLSGDVAVMAPGTNTGAAHPVLMGGGDIGKTEASKIENDAAAYIRTLCQHRGRNATLAEAGVRQSKSYTDQEALAGHLIDGIAASPQQIFTEFNDKTITRFNGSTSTLHLTNARVVVYAMTSRERFLAHLADPNLAFVLGAIGVVLLYFEFTHPGMVLPGILGALCVVLALLGFQLLPINYVGAILILLGLVLFALEAHVNAHGLLAAGGIAAMLFGSLVLIKTPWPGARIHFGVALSVTLPVGIITIILVRAVLMAARQKAVTGAEGLLYAAGVARTDLSPKGKVLVHGEIWDARAKNPIPAGGRVRVSKVEGLTLEVEPFDEPH